MSVRAHPFVARRDVPAPGRRAVRGSMAVLGALWLGVAVICLMAVDIGHVFWQQREVQKIADMAAMAGASGEAAECENYALNGARRNGLANDAELSQVQCGNWDPKLGVVDAGGGAGRPAQYFDAGRTPFNAARVSVTRTVPYFFVFGGDASRVLTATATAARSTPLAALTIRSTLVTVNPQEAALLNTVTGALLGEPLNIPVAGWNGLLAAQVNVLDYLLALGATAGNYESLLGSRVELARLLDVAAGLMERDGNAVDAAAALRDLSMAAAVRNLDIRVGDLLNVSNDTPAAGLQVGLQAFSLVQGAVQIANGDSAVASDLNVNVPGLLGLSSKIKVIEKPQTSNIGDPRLIDASAGISDPNRIYVRTAQIRTLHSFNLTGITSLANDVTNAITRLLSPLIGFLNSVVSLDLGGIVRDLVGGIACGGILPSCPVSKVIYAQAFPNATVDLGIEGAAGEAYVTDHSCGSESKSLDVQANTSLAKLRLGRIQNAFSSTNPVTVEPVAVAEIGYTEERYQSCILNIILGTLGCSGHRYKNDAGVFVEYRNQAQRTVIAGFGVRADIPLVGSQSNRELTYVAPEAANLPNLGDPPYAGPGPDPSYRAINATDVVGSLEGSLAGIDVSVYQSNDEGLLGGLLAGTVSLINGLLDELGDIIGSLLSPLLDPAINTLLPFLGIDLATTEVGARLTCRADVELVY